MPLAALALLVAGIGSAEAAGGVTGRISGRFHRDCFACGDAAKYIKATNVWCGWSGRDVVIHVTFRNSSVERIKVTWHPSYAVRNGSDHGTGLTSLQDVTLNGGQTKSVLAHQNPRGTPKGSGLSVCKPSFYLVDSA